MVDSMKTFFGALFRGAADPNYFHSFGYKDMGYDSYSFLLNGSAMMFVALISLGSSLLIFGCGRFAAGQAEKYDSDKLRKASRILDKTAKRLPHAVIRLSFMQLTFTAALDFRYLTYEQESMGTS